jgi:hypothetical protein
MKIEKIKLDGKFYIELDEAYSSEESVDKIKKALRKVGGISYKINKIHQGGIFRPGYVKLTVLIPEDKVMEYKRIVE